MKIIGLSGGIGSGKSTVAGFLADLGATAMDLDKTGHEVLKQKLIRKKLVVEFGIEILGDNGEIDRSKLANEVFNDREALTKLNAIVHPAIDEAVKVKVEEYGRQGVKVIVLEAAAMLEAGRNWQVDEVWVTIAPEAVVLKRLSGRAGYSADQARARIRSQMTNEERIRQANVIIHNDGSLDDLRDKVNIEWEKLQKRL